MELNKIKTWLELLSDPRLKICMQQAQQTKEEIIYKILIEKYGTK
jgi:hypothetical protein